MGELRKDYILDRWVVISTGRKKRPKQFKKIEKAEVKVNFFAPGNEGMTPPEIGRTGTKNKWKMRWFENKFPALQPEGQHDIRTDNSFFTYSGSYGHHEVLVETPTDKQLYDLSVNDIVQLLDIYNKIIEDLSNKPNIYYVCVFKNHGRKGGTSIVHSHSQIIALNHLPKDVRDEVEACKKFKRCPYCDIISIESQGVRKCFENDDFIAFAPYASRFNYEVWIFPKKHIRTLGDVENLKPLAEILGKVLKKIKKLGADFNYYLHYAPDGEDLHFHIEVAPRIATWAGFELGSGEIINSVSPEDAAAFYRGENNGSS